MRGEIVNELPKVNGRRFRRAVGLRYQEQRDRSPEVSIKGEESEADFLVKIAKRYRIPIVENRELARSLNQLEIDQEIHEELFEATAIVLSRLSR